MECSLCAKRYDVSVRFVCTQRLKKHKKQQTNTKTVTAVQYHIRHVLSMKCDFPIQHMFNADQFYVYFLINIFHAYGIYNTCATPMSFWHFRVCHDDSIHSPL